MTDRITPKQVQSMRENGWVFNYSPSTRFVGAHHPQGGSQSICELKNGFHNDDFGKFIADSLNSHSECKAIEKAK